MCEIGLPFMTLKYPEVRVWREPRTTASSQQTFGEVLSLNLSAGPAVEPECRGFYSSSTI